MKKTMLLIALVFISVVSFGQKDSLNKKEVDSLPQSFALVGQIQDFQLLLAAILSPDDVTPNQRKALDAWVRKIVALPKPKK